MKESGTFYQPEEIVNLYENIVPAYQTAFGGEPWFEVSKCIDTLSIKRCVGGFSSLAVGAKCEVCEQCTIRPAYETDELVARFTSLAKTRPTAWYIEGTETGATLVALAWKATPFLIGEEKYADNPAMQQWLSSFRNKPIAWLDEIFADREKKPYGNLKNFRTACIGLSQQLGSDVLAFRTINERLLAATRRDFGDNAQIYKGGRDIPDRRDFAVISIGETI